LQHNRFPPFLSKSLPVPIATVDYFLLLGNSFGMNGTISGTNGIDFPGNGKRRGETITSSLQATWKLSNTLTGCR
jgi:hypothetical protein